MRPAIEELLHRAANQRRARGAADEDHFLHVPRLELCIGERLLDGPYGAVHDGPNKRLEFAAGKFMRKDFSVRQGKVEYRGLGFRKPMLHFDESLAEFLRQFTVRRKIDAVVPENLLVDKGLEQIVDVVAPEVGVAVGREYLIDVALAGGDELQDGNVKRAAAEIVDRDAAALLFVEAVGQRRSGGFVHEAQNFEAGDFPGILGSLALGIVEVSGDGDDGAIHGFAKISLRPVSQLTKNEGGNFRRSKNFIAKQHTDDIFVRGIDAERKESQFVLNIRGAAAHEALHGVNGALRLRQQAAASGFANDDGAIGIKAHNRRAEGVAVGTRDTLRLARLRIGVRDEAVGCSQIDSDDSAHVFDQTSANSLATFVTRFRIYERRFSNSLRRAMIFFRVAASPWRAASHLCAAAWSCLSTSPSFS